MKCSALFTSMGMILFFSCTTEQKFDFPIHKIETITALGHNGEPYFTALELTPLSYASSSSEIQEVTAAFKYMDQIASLKIRLDYTTHQMQFIRIDTQSDYFVEAISILYSVPIENPAMKDTVFCSFYDGEPENRSMLEKEQNYKVVYSKQEGNPSGGVTMVLTTDLPQGKIRLSEHSTVAEYNFVHAFSRE